MTKSERKALNEIIEDDQELREQVLQFERKRQRIRAALNVKLVVSNCIKSFWIRMPVALSYPQTAQSFQPAGRDSGTRHPQWSSRGYRGRSSAPDAAAILFGQGIVRQLVTLEFHEFYSWEDVK